MEIPILFKDFAELKFPRMISEKLCDNPVVGEGFFRIFSYTEGKG